MGLLAFMPVNHRGVLISSSGLWKIFSVGVVFFFLLWFAPSFILGAIEMGRRWRWPFVLLSCVLETLLFPLWFDLVFLLSLFLEGGD